VLASFFQMPNGRDMRRSANSARDGQRHKFRRISGGEMARGKARTRKNGIECSGSAIGRRENRETDGEGPRKLGKRGNAAMARTEMRFRCGRRMRATKTFPQSLNALA
jgi:hypothetical protein